MRLEEVTMVRIYLTEDEKLLPKLLRRLHDEEQVRGVTVYRAIQGFGESGKMHSAGLIDLALDLPLVVEFFDAPKRAEAIMQHLQDEIEPGHMLSWQAKLNLGN